MAVLVISWSWGATAPSCPHLLPKTAVMKRKMGTTLAHVQGALCPKGSFPSLAPCLYWELPLSLSENGPATTVNCL